MHMKQHVLNDICPRMKTIWTDEMLREEALKYNTKSEFF